MKKSIYLKAFASVWMLALAALANAQDIPRPPLTPPGTPTVNGVLEAVTCIPHEVAPGVYSPCPSPVMVTKEAAMAAPCLQKYAPRPKMPPVRCVFQP
jgi:hypothetical protein